MTPSTANHVSLPEPTSLTNIPSAKAMVFTTTHTGGVLRTQEIWSVMDSGAVKLTAASAPRPHPEALLFDVPLRKDSVTLYWDRSHRIESAIINATGHAQQVACVKCARDNGPFRQCVHELFVSYWPGRHRTSTPSPHGPAPATQAAVAPGHPAERPQSVRGLASDDTVDRTSSSISTVRALNVSREDVAGFTRDVLGVAQPSNSVTNAQIVEFLHMVIRYLEEHEHPASSVEEHVNRDESS
ncbi:unnamed protein product [Parascedosporium putredinis]|uniref:Uncharacterized protein n=1 Tax=Parascedosporium putredinis TaxID=1442378 RepID=A0A9P1MEK9_9PEZI|nr:unnamed protein product [Parascedosporium putredinis]CAI8001767.1 unnamed protein product [Parascedosporium putredinis]